MKPETLQELAEQLLAGELSVDNFVQQLRTTSADAEQDLSQEVSLDLDRQRRCGFPEVVYGEGKQPQTVVEIVRRMLFESLPVLVTRVTDEQAALLTAEFPEGIQHPLARTFRVAVTDQNDPSEGHYGRVAVVTAGTSDRPVAEEACETLAWMGIATEFIADVGVAGPQRLLQHLDILRAMDAVIVVAGLEGALPSVVGGHLDCPIIAVPTSVGYGTGFGGIAALLSMLNSCATGVGVVNIDNGFGAAALASLITHA